VGHATRTVVECIELASVDRIVLASLLDARFLAGSCVLRCSTATFGKR
jgi:UTP:GlnB (protein PII) uridylyltransferase